MVAKPDHGPVVLRFMARAAFVPRGLVGRPFFPRGLRRRRRCRARAAVAMFGLCGGCGLAAASGVAAEAEPAIIWS